MRLGKKILAALRLEINEAGGKTELAKKLNVQHAVINRLENGTRKIQNMTISTLEKLFPQVEIIFFPSDSTFPVGKSDKTDNTRAALERDKILLEKERKIFELEKENWHLKRELEDIKNAEATRLFQR